MDVAFTLAIAVWLVGHALVRPGAGAWWVMAAALLVTGTVGYFAPQLGHVNWAVSAAGLALLLPGLVGLAQGRAGHWNGVVAGLGVFGAIAIASGVFGLQNAPEVGAAGKNLLQFWSLPLLAHVGLLTASDRRRLVRLMVLVALVQIPVSVFQAAFIVDWGNRLGGADSVVGTFGGDPEGGGASGAQTTFLVVVAAGLVAHYLAGRLNPMVALGGAAALLVPVALNETKIVFVYLPVAVLLLVASVLRARPIRTIVTVAMGASAVAALLMGYFLFLQHDMLPGQRSRTLEAYVERSLRSPAGIGAKWDSGTGITRLGSIVFWWEEHSMGRDPGAFLFGHGLGASKSTGLFTGQLYREVPRYKRIQLDRTGLAQLLWDVGMVGMLAFMSVFAATAWMARRMRRRLAMSEPAWPLLLGAEVGAVILALGNLYDTYMFTTQALNAFCMALIAYVVSVQREWGPTRSPVLALPATRLSGRQTRSVKTNGGEVSVGSGTLDGGG